MSGTPNRKRVFAHVKNDRFILESCEDTAVWAASTDVSNVATSVNHREGSGSIEFDKDGATEAFGQIARTLTKNIDLTDFLGGSIRYWTNIANLTNVVSVTLYIGEDATNNYEYTTAVADLSTGWNNLTHDVDSPTTTNGNGAAWSSVNFVAFRITFAGAGDTLNNVLLDAVNILYEPKMNIEKVNISGTNLAKETGGNLADIKAAVEIMDDWDRTDDGADTDDGVATTDRARSTQRAAVAEDDAVRPTSTPYGERVGAGYNYTNQNNRVEETDPISTHHVEDTVADITNGADGTYSYYLDMDGYSRLGMQLILSGGSGTCTVTIEGTVQDDGTAPSSCTYYDVTSEAFGAASFTASNILNDSTGFFGQFKYVKVKVVAATGAADDADWTIYSKRKF
jgi:hypothetical protein